MKITAEFVTSATGEAWVLPDGAPAVALVGRSNVGKSSLVNALARRRVARTSAAPGKTRLANLFRVSRGAGEAVYLIDLPGYGYARGGEEAARTFDELVRGVFGNARERNREQRGPRRIAALLLVDARHPGLESDVNAWRWLNRTIGPVAIVATKIDKLSRGRRIRALQQLESVFKKAVLPVSAVTGEGLDELWKLIDRPTHRHKPPTPPSRSLRGPEPLHPSA